ncbi:MAG TPA: alpha/beta hydrolase-fold protein [Polyangiaceae bacterium]|nr:alpha/beta hydrolase-fold protein [Polyangiaceae bacterium]
MHWRYTAGGALLVSLLGAFFVHCAARREADAPDGAAPRPAASVAASAVPVGVFALTQARKEVPAGVLSHPNVVGVVVRAEWQDVEPSEGGYDFSYFDGEIARVAGAGKRVSLVITSGGRNTPEWFRGKPSEKFVFQDDNAFHASFGQSIEIPVFWDAELIRHKKRLIAELGRRYASQPALELVSAQCANATTDDWNIPGGPAAVEAWKRAGFSEERLIAACKEIIDATMQAFPRQLVRMAVGRVPPGLATKPDAVARALMAYAAEHYPRRFVVQRHNLAAPTPRPDTSDKLFGWDVIRDAYPWSAAQFLWPASDTKTCRLDRGASPCTAKEMFSRAVDAALAYRLRYVEVYAADLANPELADDVTRLAQGLGAAGAPSASAPRPERPSAGVAGDARHQTFSGKISGKPIDFSIELPPSYASGQQRYPVIYWLHGKGGDEQRSTHVARYLNAAVAAGQLPEAIIVFPNGGKESFYTNSPDGSWPIETMLIDDLVPHVDAAYRTLAERGGRMLMGFSMGGFGALKFAAKYPERFGAVVAYGAPRLDASLGMRGPDAAIFSNVFGGDAAKFEENTPAYLFRKNLQRVQSSGLAIRLVGGSDDGTRHSVQKLHEVLGELGIQHEYEVLPGVRHVVAQYYDVEAGKGWAFLGRALGKR